MSGDRFWVAVQVHAGREVHTASHLECFGYEPFVPLYRARISRAHRTVKVEKALFPGYLFCIHTSACQHRIIDAPGVIQIVGFAHRPFPVPDEEIAALKIVIASDIRAEPWHHIVPGTHVQVIAGALQGLRGALIRTKTGDRLIIAVDLLQRGAAVEIDAADVIPERHTSSS